MSNDNKNERKDCNKKSDDSKTAFADYLTQKAGEFNHNSYRLNEVKLIDQTNCSDIEVGLLKFYDSGVMREMLLAAIVHSVIEHGRMVFLKSNQDLLEILKADPNAKKKRADWSSKERDRAVGYLLHAFFEEVRPPLSHPNIPAVWRVKDPRVREIIATRYGVNADDLECEQMEKILAWRDGVEEAIADRNRRKQSLRLVSSPSQKNTQSQPSSRPSHSIAKSSAASRGKFPMPTNHNHNDEK